MGANEKVFFTNAENKTASIEHMIISTLYSTAQILSIQQCLIVTWRHELETLDLLLNVYFTQAFIIHDLRMSSHQVLS